MAVVVWFKGGSQVVMVVWCGLVVVVWLRSDGGEGGGVVW